MNNHLNRQTAYKHDAHSSILKGRGKDHGWAGSINNMIDKRYAFLAMEYEDKGYLYRGMHSGLINALADNYFWHDNPENNITNLEQELDVLFMSQDVSDALNIARFWENDHDACILIFKSSIFNQAIIEKKAAMMATAEPGVVFRYPLITFPLTVSDIDFIIVRNDLKEKIINTNSKYNNKFIYIEKLDRKEVENSIKFELQRRQVIAAKTINSNFKPARIS